MAGFAGTWRGAGHAPNPAPASRSQILSNLVMEELGPELKAELARLLKMKSQQVVDIMEIYQFCEPYLKRNDFLTSPLLMPCQQIWQRYGNGSPQKLAALAAQLKEYF